MTGVRFLHTSDLHLGKPFGRFDEEVRADLRKSREEVIAGLIRVAADRRLDHVLIAGDTFDQEAPSLRLVRQTITAMAAAPDLNWWIIPGNHDNLGADLIWQTFAAHAPANVHVLTDNTPVAMTEGAFLLPAPCPRRAPGYDLTETMVQQATPDRALRIGLAHGGVVDFRPEEPSAEVIPPDRAERAGLDYLALGDWHGMLQITPRTFYCGTPERDRFKHPGRGTCLSVHLAGPGAVPQIEQVELGRYDWRAPDLVLTPGMDAVAALHALLPADRGAWRDMLVRLDLQGYLHLADRMTLLAELGRIAPEFCHFEWRDAQLQTEYRPDDLDQIARGGALRVAADTLKGAADDADLSRADRDVADAALTRLYSLVKEAAS